MNELISLVRDVLAARIALPRVEESLNAILAALPDLERNPDLRVELQLFVYELMKKYVIGDKLPLRVAALARIGWRTVRLARQDQATPFGLFATLLLRDLEADEEALALIKLVEVDARRSGGLILRAAVTMHARSLVDLQRFKDAHQLAREYEESGTAKVPDLIELHMLTRGASAADAVGEVQDALDRARRGVELFEMGPARMVEDRVLDLAFPPIGASRVYMTLGDARRRSHDHLGAIDAYQQGRVRSLQEEDRVGAAWCLSEIAITWEHLCEFARGAQLLEQAAWEAERAGDTKAAARWRKQHVPGEDGGFDVKGVNGLAAIAEVLRTQGPNEEIERLAKSIIKEESGTGTTIEPMARNVLAGIYAAGKRYALALAAISAAIATADKLNEKWLALAFRCNQAQILFNLHLWDSANRHCDRVFDDAEHFLGEARTSEIRQAAMSVIAVATEIALVTASAEATIEGGEARPRDPKRAVATIDRTHGRTFNRWLALRDWSRQARSTDVESAARNLIAANVVVESAAHDSQPMKPVLEERRLAQETLTRVAAEFGVMLPQSPGEGHFPDLAVALQSRAVILGLTSIQSGIVCVCFESGIPVKTGHFGWSREERTAWHERWRSAWTLEARKVGVLAGEDAAGATKPDDMDKLYAELQEVFAGPLAKWLGPNVDHLIVAIHAELASIPLWALARTLPNVTLSVVPTLRSVALFAGRGAPGGQENIAIGDATSSLRMAPRECELLCGYSTVAPGVEELRRAAPRARRIHFAGHGEFDSENPYSSGLILRGVNRAPYAIASAYRGCVRLTIAGILKWLDVAESELITISACSVGTPRSHAASEFTSVPTALLLAGARNVLAAGWRVHDAATTVLMSHFYANLESEGCAAAALAAARHALARVTREEASAILGRDDVVPPDELPFASPIFTDAFMHYGIPRSALARQR